MRNALLFIAILVLIFSVETKAQDIHSIFNNKLSLDNNLSNQTKAAEGLMATYGEVQIKVYSFDGSFQEAVNTMDVPQNANVGTVSEQSLGIGLGMFLFMIEDLDPKPMNEAWFEKARKKVDEYESIMGKSLSVTIEPEQMQNPENLKVGDKIEMRIISLSQPYMDMDNLELVEGAWVSETHVTTMITEDMLEDDFDDFEEGWDEEEIDMDVDLPEGAHFVGFDDVADTEWLQGDVNYLVEMSADQAVSFFKKDQKRYVNNFEQTESYSQDGDMTMVSYFYMLKHQGELKSGDDVVSLTIMSAPGSILSDALGRNQGTWTLISISRWTEEDY